MTGDIIEAHMECGNFPVLRLGHEKNALIKSTAVNRYFESDRKFHEENMKLTSEYKRITEQFKDLQLKFKHFELSDSKKYTEVWKMKEDQVVQLAKRVVAADQVLHEQQLGLAWQAPNEEVSFLQSALLWTCSRL